MTREEAQQVERQLSERYPGGSVEVTRVPGGVWVEARDAGGWTFLRVADGSPLLTLLGAYPETEPTPRQSPGSYQDRVDTLPSLDPSRKLLAGAVGSRAFCINLEALIA
jgi:hypothetical protein